MLPVKFFNETEKKLIYELGNHQWEIPELRKLLEKIIPENAYFNDYEVEQDFLEIGHKKMLLNARRIRQDGQPYLILLAIEDITDRHSG